MNEFLGSIIVKSSRRTFEGILFIPICVSSIQELDRRLEAEKAKVAELLARVEALENNVP